MSVLRWTICSALPGLFFIFVSTGHALPLEDNPTASAEGSHREARNYDDYPSGDFNDLQSLNEPELSRLARFILDFGGNQDSNDYYTGSGYGGGDAGKTGGLLNLNLDSQAVVEGIFKPENIAIHVAQNAFNFFTTSLAWVVAGSLYSGNVGRSLNPSSLFGGLPNPLKGLTKPSTDSYSSPSSSGYGTSYGFASRESESNLNGIDSSDQHAMISQFLAPTYRGVSEQNKFDTKTGYSPRDSDYSKSMKFDQTDRKDTSDVHDLSVDEIKKLLDVEEKSKVGVFDDLTKDQKYKMYSKAKAMTMVRRSGASSSSQDNYGSVVVPPTLAKPPSENNEQFHQKKHVRRRRKLIRKPSLVHHKEQ